MTAITVTLNSIRKHSPCASGWRMLLASLPRPLDYDAPITFQHIIASNGVRDAIWVLRAIDGHNTLIRCFAVDCAEHVAHLLRDERSKNALVVARRYTNGEASAGELLKAAYAADAAAATYAANAAAYAADAATYAANAAAYAADAAAAASAADAAAYAAATYAANAAADAAAEREWQAARLIQLTGEHVPNN